MKSRHIIPLITSLVFIAVVVVLAKEYLFKSIDSDYAFGIDQLKTLENNGLPKNELSNLIDIFENRVNKDNFENKTLIVTFWASWCSPCVEEFPSFLQLLKAKENVVILAVSLDEETKEALGFLKSMSIDSSTKNFIVTHDIEKTISKSFGVIRLPESFIFDKNGKFLRKIVGATDWASEGSLNYFSKFE